MDTYVTLLMHFVKIATSRLRSELHFFLIFFFLFLSIAYTFENKWRIVVKHKNCLTFGIKCYVFWSNERSSGIKNT